MRQRWRQRVQEKNVHPKRSNIKHFGNTGLINNLSQGSCGYFSFFFYTLSLLHLYLYDIMWSYIFSHSSSVLKFHWWDTDSSSWCTQRRLWKTEKKFNKTRQVESVRKLLTLGSSHWWSTWTGDFRHHLRGSNYITTLQTLHYKHYTTNFCFPLWFMLIVLANAAFNEGRRRGNWIDM